MSQIFDALQRSEAERAGIDLSALPETTELLQRAERHSASKWEGAVLPEQHDTAKSGARDTPFGLQTVPPVGTEPEASVAAELLSADERLGLFNQFQSLQVSLPLQGRLVCLTDSASPAAEAFRLLGVRLRHLRRDRPLKKVLITSTIPEEGKSIVAANLACTLARRTQQRTLLLEGDVRRPSLSEKFGLGTNPGLCEWLQGESSLTTNIYRLEGPGLWILPAGSTPSNPLELLQSGRLSALMDQLSAWFDWIIIDSPPVLPLADTSVWSRLADGILLVTRQGTTEKKQLQRGLEALEAQKLIGGLLNCSKNSDHSDYYYRPSAALRSNDGSTK